MSVLRVTVVIPCRNETEHIERCLESVLATEHPHDRLEVFVVDGMSDDGTRAKIAAFAAGHSVVRMLDNPARITPTGLNIGIAAATGDVIVRMDAHAFYPSDYVPRLVAALVRSEADNVGGVLRTVPGGSGPVARAIAIASSHPLGVGNARFRVGSTKERWVDTVPFGCFRREVFDRIGAFDEDLVRNQDDEFNHRLIRAGGRVLLVPDVASTYVARATLSALWRMYFQYGYFKPLVLRKLGGAVTLRQFAPAALVLGLTLPLLAGAFVPGALLAWLGLVGAYGLALGAVSLTVDAPWAVRLRLPFAFATLHLAYGVGFLRGVVEFLLLRRSGATASRVRLSR